MTALACEVRQFGTSPPAQECPMCEGLLPADAVTVTGWRMDWTRTVPALVRRVSMQCPHCGHRQSRTEVRERWS